VTWLNVWLFLLYLRLLLSFTLLICLYITIGLQPKLPSENFNTAVFIIELAFLYMDQPLIVGSTLTILVIYYRVGVKKHQNKKKRRQENDTEEVRNILEEQAS
jgi:hypothetical protein